MISENHHCDLLPNRNIYFSLAFFHFFPTKSLFFPDPLSFSTHHISKFRVSHEMRRGNEGIRPPPPVLMAGRAATQRSVGRGLSTVMTL